jgi:protein-disulfide isomerase
VPVLEQVLEKYPNDVKIAFKNYPLKNHKFAKPAALAALAANEQGKFWEFHDLLFKNYSKLNDQKIQEIAQTVGLDLEAYEKKKKDPATRKRVNQDLADGRRAGVRGTPTIFINGIRLRDRSLKGFQTAINKQLQKLNMVPPKPSS